MTTAPPDLASSPGRRLRCAVAGASGYIGMECVAALRDHPGVELTKLLARSNAGRRFCDVVPGSDLDLVLEDGLDCGDVDVVFSALPHTVAASRAREWLERGAVVIDLSADFRLRDPAAYERWYGVAHPAPDLCAEAVYALCELDGGALRAARLIAAPGCYPTAGLLATAPALRANLVEPRIVVDAKSGVSGAGRSPSLRVHFAEVNESVAAYAVEGHRHKAELLQELGRAADRPVDVVFVPHLVPMTRGILATAYMTPRPGVDRAALVDLYREWCASHPFLRYDASPPTTKSVAHSNVAALSVGWQDGTVVVTCAVDNLVRGAAGQAVQAFNLRFGFPETTGLRTRSPWP